MTIMNKNNFNQTKLDKEGKYLVGANYDGSAFAPYDDCAVCRLEKKCKVEGRVPTEGELMFAMFEASQPKTQN